MMIQTSNLPYDLLKVTKQAVEFYIDRYFDKRTKNRVELVVIAFRKMEDDSLAVAGIDDEYLSLRRLPREFLIEFNNIYRDIPIRDYLITLFHEMTHLHQYATGRLRPYNEESLKWEGEVMKVTEENYWDLPWEREAMAIESGAYVRFADVHPEYDLGRWRPSFAGRSLSDWGKPLKNKDLTIPVESKT